MCCKSRAYIEWCNALESKMCHDVYHESVMLIGGLDCGNTIITERRYIGFDAKTLCLLFVHDACTIYARGLHQSANGSCKMIMIDL